MKPINIHNSLFSIINSELLSHENVTFNDNGTLTTIPHHPLEWREELSEGRSEDDILYLPNIALLVSTGDAHASCKVNKTPRTVIQGNSLKCVYNSDTMFLQGQRDEYRAGSGKSQREEIPCSSMVRESL